MSEEKPVTRFELLIARASVLAQPGCVKNAYVPALKMNDCSGPGRFAEPAITPASLTPSADRFG